MPPQTIDGTPLKPVARPPAQELQSVFKVLKLNLKHCLHAFKNGEMREELQKALHDDQSLPDKQIAASAAATINLLHELEQLLEPGHLVLADHFLGSFPCGFVMISPSS